jgi:hypothetical protein
MPGIAEREFVVVKGLNEMSRAFARADKGLKKDLRSSMKEIADPVRADAERLAGSKIRNMGAGPWAGMRVGVTQNLVYVAPKQRGRASRRNDRIRRPNLADLLMDRAMNPALDAHASEIEDAFGDALDGILDRWGR